MAEVRQSLDWLAENGHEYGISGPALLSGWSAGGHLTAMALDHPRVTAGLAISGVFDLFYIRDTGLNAALDLKEEEIETLSPLRLPVVPKPLAIAYGTRELPALIHDPTVSTNCARPRMRQGRLSRSRAQTTSPS